jgi:hypothetical protein
MEKIEDKPNGWWWCRKFRRKEPVTLAMALADWLTVGRSGERERRGRLLDSSCGHVHIHMHM